MTTRTLSKPQQDAWTKYLESQGCSVVRKRKGLMVRFPDGGSDTIHITPSERRGLRNAIAKFRRHGVVHPLDPRRE